MGISLTQFVADNNGMEVDTLISKMHLYPPQHSSEPRSQDVEITTIANIIFQRQFRFVMAHASDLFGYSLTSKEHAMHAHLFSMASSFAISSIGNCGPRASYASLFLGSALPDHVRVILRSSPIRDHYMVYLSSVKDRWFVYDPFTNPDIVFPHALYIHEILPKIPEQTRKFDEFKLTISKTLSKEFYGKWPFLSKKLIAQFLQTIATQEELVKDPFFLNALQIKGIDLNDSNISSGLERVQSIISRVF